ncbi:MAG: glycoside hydrolase family 3 N-terminal domain-containing protein [Gemmatimonadota bacterium]
MSAGWRGPARKSARALLSALVLVGACRSTGALPESSLPPTAGSRPLTSRCESKGDAEWVDCVLAGMSLRDKAAQMVWPQVFGDYVPADAPQWRKINGWIAQQHVGGIIMSVGSPLEIALKLNALQRISDLPLLVGGDLEFGAGYRARGGYFLPNGIDLGGAVLFPPEMAIGATRDTMLAYEQGRITALEGRALGFHIDFSPILDVNNNPENPVISTRSFGEDPALVASLGTAFIRGVQEHGMIATGKHFPGHGDTGTNSHLALPVVRASRARLDSVELVPFKAAVKANVGAIMTFHGSMPALDSSGAPGTLSHNVLTSLLREDMHFRGLVVSDAMDMGGVLNTYGPVNAAQLAVAAGADVLLQPQDVATTIDAVVAGVTAGRFTEARLDESVRRILATKARLGLRKDRLVNPDSARAMVGDSANAAVARMAAERSITLVRDSAHQLPLSRLNHGARILSVTYAHRSDLGAGVTFDAELRKTFPAVRPEYVNADDERPDFFRLLSIADSADVILVSSYVSHSSTVSTISAPRAFVDFIEELQRRKEHPVVMAFGNPYLLQQIPDASAYVVAWGGFPVSQSAAARALLGLTPMTGKLPITIPGT